MSISKEQIRADIAAIRERHTRPDSRQPTPRLRLQNILANIDLLHALLTKGIPGCAPMPAKRKVKEALKIVDQLVHQGRDLKRQIEPAMVDAPPGLVAVEWPPEVKQ
jgi:hypothetical protein